MILGVEYVGPELIHQLTDTLSGSQVPHLDEVPQDPTKFALRLVRERPVQIIHGEASHRDTFDGLTGHLFVIVLGDNVNRVAHPNQARREKTYRFLGAPDHGWGISCVEEKDSH